MSLIAPGAWIEPIDPNMRWEGPAGLGRPRFLTVPRKPYFCEGLVLTNIECPTCKNNGGVWIEVKEFPDVAFCPTHWRPLPPSIRLINDLKEKVGVTQ